MKLTEENWSLVIRPQRAWWDLRLGELWRYRDLVWLFVWRDFVAYYKQTILGPLWYLIQPILTTGVFTIIFGNIAQLSTDGLPPFLFYLAGNTVWTYFSASLTSTSSTFTSNAGLFGKVYFPRLVIPLSIVFSQIISFGLRFLVFLGFLIYFMASGSDVYPNWWILLMPIHIVIMAGLGLGMGIIVSSLTTKYRDLQQLVGFGAQLLMYATPVIYPLSSITGGWRWLILANPMTPVVETFRLAFLGTSAMSPAYLLYSLAFTFLVLLIGVLIFNRVENNFMDTV
ncbi:MAG: ABC transporter permease [Chloroflexi bacterium]|nr:ABC transporter permease [Chloroflexi bacterium CFX1]MCQ3954060.1 ABC transporter permease [Chloroflexota bacterium]MDL1918174.1 ABC transporter permease [Chloroflexi bacterium CFX5]NUQ60368.1 ABC transporter permease [Anaerolineales bacterium]RIK55652.1 MAG: ABC transporter permease [Chloroflexota bacterium]